MLKSWKDYNLRQIVLKKLAKRPLLKDIEKAKKLHKERNSAYARKADIIIIAEDKSPKKIAKEILKALKGQK